MKLPLFLREITDSFTRENFRRIIEGIERQTILKGQWNFFELTFDGAVTNAKIAHGLGTKPKDVIQTSVIGPGAITFNYSLFDESFVDITTTGACKFRGFIGLYSERL